MRAVLFILLIISASKACTIRCSNSSDTSLTLIPSENNIEGRYKVEFCTKADKNVIEWDLVMKTIDSKRCQNFSVPPRGHSHSRFRLSVENNLNCTHVCFSTLLDLMYNDTCYHIKTSLIVKNSTTSSNLHDSYHHTTNNITKEHYTAIKPVAYREGYDGGLVLVKWNLGYVPAYKYYVVIKDNETDVRFNTSCNVSGKFQSEVLCKAWLPPGRCYKAELVHREYWITTPSLFGHITYVFGHFCESMPDTPLASSSPIGEWPKAVATAGLLLSVVAVYCVVRRRHVAAWQRRVRENWLKKTSKEPVKPSNMEGNILLLYARDCTTFTRAAERLGALVQRATGCQVIDVYSGASTRLWAPAGDEWLRLMLARGDTRVLLLQSPAGALLAAELAETRAGPALAAPLLGSLVSWRRPHAGDALLSLALRQLAAAPPSAPYKKHYVANICDLGADMAPGVTPYRRYSLPDTVACLLRDLAPNLKLATSLDLELDLILKPGLEKAPSLVPTPDLEPDRSDLETLLQQFKEAADAFTNHVRDHPDYLADELLFK